MTEQQEQHDPATMPEKAIEIHYVYRLKDGRVIEEYSTGMYADPSELDFTDAGEVIEYAQRIHDQGFEAIYPLFLFVPGEDGNLVQVPTEGPLVVFEHNINSVEEKVIIRDLSGDQEIASALHNRQIDELRRMQREAEAEERAKGVPQKPVVPPSDEQPMRVMTVADVSVRQDGPEMFLEVPFVLENGSIKRLRFAPELVHQLGHLFLGPQHPGHNH
ncbi:hypothetical protein GCM10010149_88570 [Nonomuraea roseoviolacea subsp. roseoviolacea]|uniref:hypothetical protein n=1 Tax=Nonomuraea roseoviolacea TaxID=103837 RepID=UPI0031D95A99